LQVLQRQTSTRGGGSAHEIGGDGTLVECVGAFASDAGEGAGEPRIDDAATHVDRTPLGIEQRGDPSIDLDLLLGGRERLSETLAHRISGTRPALGGSDDLAPRELAITTVQGGQPGELARNADHLSAL